MSQTLSLAAARSIIINSQRLNASHHFSGNDGVLTCLNHLGYIQIDAINIVQRAHHHTLWARVPDYHPHMLHELQTAGRIFEYWAHAMSYVPMADYRYYLPRMRWFDNPTHYWFKQRQEMYEPYTELVLERLVNEGPLRASDFERKPGDKSGTWFEHKSAKGALELLFWRGEIMVKERRHFHKVYDVTERILPESIDTTCPSEAEWGHFFVQRAMQALGIAREKDIVDYIETTKKTVLAQCLAHQLEEGAVLKIKIDGLPGDYYILADTKPGAQELKNEDVVHILSPFDNAVISRDRLRRFFNFDYSLECYLPSAKRRFGYFGLPILVGTHFVGQIDARADREHKKLIINNIVMDDRVHSKDFFSAVAQKLLALARFNGCESVHCAASDSLCKKLLNFTAPE